MLAFLEGICCCQNFIWKSSMCSRCAKWKDRIKDAGALTDRQKQKRLPSFQLQSSSNAPFKNDHAAQRVAYRSSWTSGCYVKFREQKQHEVSSYWICKNRRNSKREATRRPASSALVISNGRLSYQCHTVARFEPHRKIGYRQSRQISLVACTISIWARAIGRAMERALPSECQGELLVVVCDAHMIARPCAVNWQKLVKNYLEGLDVNAFDVAS